MASSAPIGMPPLAYPPSQAAPQGQQMASPWKECTDANQGNKVYYHNAKTGASVWEKPADFDQKASAPPTPAPPANTQAHLPSPWKEFKDPSGKPYYYNEQTKLTVWDKPADFAPTPASYVMNPTTTTTPLCAAPPCQSQCTGVSLPLS